MILGISASGRANGVTADAVKAVLQAAGQPTEFISLAGKQINGCMGCVACGGDNRCIQQDDWLSIGDKMVGADAIVFGAANYYGYMNALAHACLERTFAFRHQERFLLAGKMGVAVATDGGDQNNTVLEHIRKMMLSNQMAVIGTVYAMGYSQCYTCGYGHDCAVGGVVGRHGFQECISDDMLPARFDEQPNAVFQAYRVGKALGSIIRAKIE